MTVVIVGARGWLGGALLRHGPPGSGDEMRPSDRIDPAVPPQQWAQQSGLGPGTAVINASGGLTGDPALLSARFTDLPAYLAAACRLSGAHLVHIGSAAECGLGTRGERIGELRPCEPVSPYGRAKLAGTRAVLAAGGGACVARVFNIAGWPLTRGTVFDHLARQFCQPGRTPTVETPGMSFERDYLDLDTVASTIVDLARLRAAGLVHVCSGEATTGAQLLDWCAGASGRTPEVRLREPADTSSVVGDPNRLRGLLGRPIACDWDALAAGFSSAREWVSPPRAPGRTGEPRR